MQEIRILFLIKLNSTDWSLATTVTLYNFCTYMYMPNTDMHLITSQRNKIIIVNNNKYVIIIKTT